MLLIGESVGRSGNPQQGIPVDDPSGGQLSQTATMFWRPDALAHVRVVQGSPATGTAGVWLPQTYADAAHARVGDRITMAGTQVPVAGVYTDLFDTDYGSYWCDYKGYFLNEASANTPPPALVLATDRGTLLTVAATARFLTVAQQVHVDAAGLSTSEAHDLLAQQDRAERASVGPDDPVRPGGEHPPRRRRHPGRDHRARAARAGRAGRRGRGAAGAGARRLRGQLLGRPPRHRGAAARRPRRRAGRRSRARPRSSSACRRWPGRRWAGRRPGVLTATIGPGRRPRPRGHLRRARGRRRRVRGGPALRGRSSPGSVRAAPRSARSAPRRAGRRGCRGSWRCWSPPRRAGRCSRAGRR